MTTTNTMKELENVLKTLGNHLQEATSKEEYREIANQFGAVQNALTILNMVENMSQLSHDYNKEVK